MTEWIDGAGRDIKIGDSILYYFYRNGCIERSARIVYKRGLTERGLYKKTVPYIVAHPKDAEPRSTDGRITNLTNCVVIE